MAFLHNLGRPLFRPPARPTTWRRAAAGFALLLMACVPRGDVVAPQVAPSSTLNLSAPEVGQEIPFSLAYSAPRGPVSGDPEVHLVFSRPLRALGADTPIPEGLVLRPAVEGAWQWVGVQALTFVPKAGRLPRATEFVVEVPASLRSLDGEKLSRAERFSFQTATAEITEATPSRWESDSTPNRKAVLRFSQPVSPEELGAFMTAHAGGQKIEVKTQATSDPQVLEVLAPLGWPLDSTIELTVAPGFKGLEGELRATKEFRHSFRTYGPLTATIECDRNSTGRCRPEGSLYLRLSNPVHARTLSRAITADGTTLHVDQEWEPETETTHISLGATLLPRQNFTVTLGAVKDVYGQSLRWLKNRQVEVADYAPNVTVGFTGDALPRSEREIAIGSMNTPYELLIAPLTANELVRLDALQGPQRVAAVQRLPKASLQKIPRGALNQRERHVIELDPITRHGPFAIGIRYQGEQGPVSYVKWGQRTSLSLTAKAGRDRGHVWVTHLTTGHPVAGASVRVLGEAGAQAHVTGPDGLVSLDPGQFDSSSDKSRAPRWLEVRSGPELIYRSSSDGIGEWRVPVSTDFYGDESDTAFLFPERDLFRPGESAWLKGYVRRPSSTGSQPVAGGGFTLTLVSPSGEDVSSQPVDCNAFGALSSRVLLPASGELGQWSIQLKRGTALLASTEVQLAEYRPSDFEVTATSKQQHVLAGEPIDFQASAVYFSGGAMGGAPVETSVRREPTGISIPDHEQFVASDDEWQYFEPYLDYSAFLGSETQELDAAGRLTRRTETRLDKQVGPERLEFEATVTDLSSQALSARAGAVVHPAAYYAAFAPSETNLVDAPSEVRPQVVAVTPQGKRVSGQPIDLKLYRVRYTHVRSPGSGSAGTTNSEPVRELVSACQLVSLVAPAGCALTVSDSGSYIVRATIRDEKGRVSSSSSSFYAVGGGRAAAWRDDDERGVVTLKTDRESYSEGQTARILVQSPFSRARAWVTIEKDGVVSGRVVSLQGTSPTITVPITSEMRPNAYVGVHLIEDREALGKKAHALGDSYRIGYAELRLDPEKQRLSVQVEATKSKYEPRDEVELKFSVKGADAAPKRAEVAVFVVDEGVLSLSGYQLPDPLTQFTRPRPLRVETVESRESVARVFGIQPGQNENKGDPGGGGDSERSAMLTAAYFNPSILTDRAGRASVKFKLPDNIGRFRVMAVAVTSDDRYGKGQSSLTVSKALMARPALPRFLRAGDAFNASVVVSALEFPGGPVHVTAKAEGLEVVGEATRTIQLQKGGSQLVEFSARAPNVGRAKISFHLSGGVHRDAVMVSRQVASPAVLEAVALYGKTQKAEGHRLADLSKLRKDMGQLDVTLASSALVGLGGGFEQLWDYPYLCSEQLASRALPLLMLRDLASLYGVSAPKDASSRIGHSVAQLIARQQGDGGFGMWPESTESIPWVSAYTLWVLGEAQKRGFIVPGATLERGRRYLSEVAGLRQDDQLTEAVFATLVLGKLGKPDAHTVLSLFEHASKLTVEGRVLLLYAAAEAKATSVVPELLSEVEGAITVRGNKAEMTAPLGDNAARFMSSSTRRSALAVSALLAAKPTHPLAAALVAGLLDARRGDGWRSTQESAFALMALDDYRLAQEKEEPDFLASVFLGGKLLGQERFLGRSTRAKSFSTEMKQLTTASDLIFELKGTGTLFYEARLMYARMDLPLEGLESGFMVQKVMTKAKSPASAPSDAVKPLSFERGDLVVIDVTVLAPAKRRYVVVDDPLPAGFEAQDLSLETAQGSLLLLLSEQKSGFSDAWHRTELRDDRILTFVDDMPAGVYRYRTLARATTSGTFVTPPTRAMEMYQPEVYGRTGATRVTIR